MALTDREAAIVAVLVLTPAEVALFERLADLVHERGGDGPTAMLAAVEGCADLNMTIQEYLTILIDTITTLPESETQWMRDGQ